MAGIETRVAELRRLAETAFREGRTLPVPAAPPQTVRCWPWSHAWGRWERSPRGISTQERQCQRCGLIKRRRL